MTPYLWFGVAICVVLLFDAGAQINRNRRRKRAWWRAEPRERGQLTWK